MRTVPTYVITSKIEELKGKLDAITGIPNSERAVEFVEAQLAMLRGLLDAGEASATDFLDRNEAMKWSGLKKDALDSYPHMGRYSSKRWRRGDLPVRNPFGTAEFQPNIQRVDQTEVYRDTPEQAMVRSREEKLQRALEESRAA
jgi:hypothetical protein